MRHSLLRLCLLVFAVSALLRAQTPTITNVTNNPGNSSVLCPGDWATIIGTNLGGAAANVKVGTKQAYIINSATPGLLFIEIPVDAPVGPTTVTVGASAPFNITLVQFAPELRGVNGPPNFVQAFHVANGASVTASYPAAPNEQVGLVAVGLGPTTPVVPTGTPSPNNPTASVNTLPAVSLGGKPATVISAYLWPNSSGPALYAIVVAIPGNATTGNLSVTVTAGGNTSNQLPIPVTTAPIISSIVNAASGNVPGLPNAGIAQGAIFLIVGGQLGPSAISVAPAPFQSASLSGTSVSVSVAGTTVAAPMYYTSAGQVAALLPSNTPTGTGTATVTYSGQTSVPAPITVVQNNLGILTITSDGEGAGLVTYPDYSLVSTSKAANCGGPSTTCGAANPGDTLILWATGLGPVSGNDAAGAGLGVDMTSIPLQLWLGGVQATVLYRGRGCCIGEDQIVFTVPSNVPTGCAVPLSVQIDSEISNGVAIPVASGSRTCTPTDTSFGTAAGVPLLGTGPVNYGGLKLKRQDNEPGFQDVADVQFARASGPAADQPFILVYLDLPAPGTCQIYNSLNNGFNPPLTITNLDAGSSLSVKGPSSTQNVVGAGGQFKGTLSANGNFLVPGTFTVSLPGGADIPAFSASITIPALPTMTSPPPDTTNSFPVTRSSGLTVTWTGGSPAAGFVVLYGGSATDNTYSTGASFTCVAPASAGTFTVPPNVLLAMPAGNFGGVDFYPTVSPVILSVTGLNVAFVSAQYDYFAALNFK